MSTPNTIIRSLPKSYVVIDTNFSIKDASDCFLSQRQIKREALIRMNIAELSKKDSRELHTTFKAVFQTGKSCGATHPIIDKNGAVRYIIHEIMDEDLMDSHHASDVLDRITDGFFTLSHNWIFTNVNPVTRTLLRKSKNEIMGRPFFDVFPLKESEIFMAHFFQSSTTKSPTFFEAPYGETVFSVQAYPQKDGGIAVFYRDVTEKKKAQQELEEALTTKNEFISIASHELKTPLTALKLQVEMAKRTIDRNGPEALSPEKIKNIINRTHQDIFRLSRLVDDMLDVSRINTGNFNMSYKFFNLDEFFEEFLSRSPLGDAGERVIIKKINAPVMVKWDKFRIEQVILNLLTNAVRYGGDSKVELSVDVGGGQAYIKVKDNGPGIPKEDQEKIFKPYERGSNKKHSEGFGLGLYLCHEIIGHHQGVIKLNSVLGKGATFELQIPLTFKTTDDSIDQ